MPNPKGSKPVTRQNFSMHPDLMEALMTVSHKLNNERVLDIAVDRSKKVTYSKVASALAWLLKRDYLADNNEITNRLRRLIADYEATEYEKIEPIKRKSSRGTGRSPQETSLSRPRRPAETAKPVSQPGVKPKNKAF